MERLTRRMCGGWGLVEGYELSNPRGCRAVVDRLAAYEGTGLEPNEVIAVKNERDFFGKGIELLHKENTEYNALGSIDRLRELAQDDREGRVVVLPCKVGDTVYKICPISNFLKIGDRWSGRIIETDCDRCSYIACDCHSIGYMKDLKNVIVERAMKSVEMIARCMPYWGEIYFLTKEEAQEYLEEKSCGTK